jgi:hypothetical protein
VAAEVTIDAVQLEASGISSNGVSLLDDRDVGKPLLDKLVGRAGAGRAGSKDHDMLSRGSIGR